MDYKFTNFNYNKIQYYFNVIYYCLLLHEIRFGKFMTKLADIPLNVMRCCFTKKFRKVYDDRMAKAQPDLDKFFFNMSEGWAEREFIAYCGGYPFIIGAILSSLIIKYIGILNLGSGLVFVLIYSVICCSLIEICLKPVKNIVFKNDNHTNYFEEFKNQNRQWHKKWNRITFLFCIGGIISYIIGGSFMFLILIS